MSIGYRTWTVLIVAAGATANITSVIAEERHYRSLKEKALTDFPSEPSQPVPYRPLPVAIASSESYRRRFMLPRARSRCPARFATYQGAF